MSARSFKKHKDQSSIINNPNGTRVVQRNQSRMIERTLISEGSTTTTITPLPLPPQPLFIQKKPPPQPVVIPDPIITNNIETPLPKARTQKSQTLQEFQDALPQLLHLLLSHHASHQTGLPCTCGRINATKVVRCYDCMESPLVCRECFLESHACLPTHWAEVWDSIQGFFVRHDISTLIPGCAAINLGHGGRPCPSRHSTVLDFQVIDINGIHRTTIKFCFCAGTPCRAEQLFNARLFPATMSQPTMAFTFQSLHQFHIHHLESKESAHDFIGSLRRLSDNAFPHSIPDPSTQFRTVMRIWRLLIAQKRLGHAHNIDSILTHRREGNLIVHCPSCPDPHLNMDAHWIQTPRSLCHLNQIQLTADGNHHSNKYAKNTDPDDISLFQGLSYFPDNNQYMAYVNMLSTHAPEKIGPCEHLNALNKQNRKKFKNMEITGIVNIQCGHIFIKSSVDLQLGEKFANTDYALSHALSNTYSQRSSVPLTTEDQDFAKHIHRVMSYDVTCGYHVNAKNRFDANFSHHTPFIEEMTWLIPLVHVNNHKDNCTYMYSSAYHPNVGHFQGETAEMPWVELNQLAPQTRQMNNGHRQDTIMDHHSHWNWAKTSQIAATLFKDVENARLLFRQKFTAFQTLCDLNATHIEKWDLMDRDQRKKDKYREVQCVYRQKETKVPSQARIYTALLSETERRKSAVATSNSTAPFFINEGLLIAAEQTRLIVISKAADTTAFETIEEQRTVLSARISKWRTLQKRLVPQIGDTVAQQAISGQATECPEHEILYLPSDFSESKRVEHGLVSLGEMERKFREGAAYDFIQNVRISVKTISAMHHQKKTQGRGQRYHTRANTKIHDFEVIRDVAIANYSATRSAIINLSSEEDTQFPPLSIADTFRKPTNLKRMVGDSRRMDGMLWTKLKTSNLKHGSTAGSSGSNMVLTAEYPHVGTQMRPTKRKILSPSKKAKGTKRRRIQDSASDTVESRQDGWIWTWKADQNMSDSELNEWMSEGDRVQWFRAEAEMQRWREEWEIKQSEFRRCILYFGKMSNVWTKLVGQGGYPGHNAYAKRQAGMFLAMENEAKRLFTLAGYGHLIELPEGKILADFILEERQKEEYYIPQLDRKYSEANLIHGSERPESISSTDYGSSNSD